MRAALKRKTTLSAEAARLRREVELAHESAQIKLDRLQRKVKEAEDNVVEIERREKLRVVRGDAAGKGSGKLGILVNLAKTRIEELRRYLDTTKKQRDAMVDRITELEGLLSALKDEHNPNFNDDGVKRAVRGWEDYAARDTDDSWTEAENRDLVAVLAEDNDSNGINWAEFESDDSSAQPESDVAALYHYSSYLPDSLRLWIDGKLTAIRRVLVENGILADVVDVNLPPSTDSKAVADAKKILTDAEREVKTTETDLKRHLDDLDKDYGPDGGIFRALKDQCISRDSGEYEYEMCWLGQTRQKPKKGGANTNMGNFVGFDMEFVDEGLGKDGKGLGTGERLVLKYENGQGCWNGPARSTRVYLACSEVDEVWKVSESEKCVYRMEVGTAAVCQAPGSKKPEDASAGMKGNDNGNGGVKKDEL